MLTRKNHEIHKKSLLRLAKNILYYCAETNTPTYDVWFLSDVLDIEKIWDNVVDLYRPEFIANKEQKDHLLHRFYIVVLEKNQEETNVDYYIEETFYGRKKCGEYKFCELYDNVCCECRDTCA